MDLLAAHEGVALVSQPEPDWMTPDWRKRIIIARCVMRVAVAALCPLDAEGAVGAAAGAGQRMSSACRTRSPALCVVRMHLHAFAAARTRRPTLEERRKLAAGMHAWRLQVGADTLTQRPPAHFDWFHQHLQLRLLAVTPQHHVVLLLKVRGTVRA